MPRRTGAKESHTPAKTMHMPSEGLYIPESPGTSGHKPGTRGNAPAQRKARPRTQLRSSPESWDPRGRPGGADRRLMAGLRMFATSFSAWAVSNTRFEARFRVNATA